MQPGAIVVVRLASGPSIRRVIEVKGGRVRLALGRNREARLPINRVLLELDVALEGEDALKAFSAGSESLSAGIDLAEAWELVVDDPSPMSLAELADLYWAESPSPVQLSALLLHLENDDLYFEGVPGGYLPRPEAKVKETLCRRRRQAERRRAFAGLAARLASGEAPDSPGRYERELIDHLKGFVVYGDNYTRAASARELIAAAAQGPGDHRRQAFGLLTGAGLMHEDEPLELIEAEIPDEFPDEVLRLAADVEPAAALADGARIDLTGVPTFTIDNAGTADRDDAVSLERLDGRYRLGIHIADAASIVERGDAVCAEAARRSASLYLPERTIPMLPPSISEAAGSLDPHLRRPALSAMVEVTDDGNVLGWEIVPSIVRSDAALSYDEADRQASGSGEWSATLSALDRIARALAAVRTRAGAVSMRRPEMEVSVSESGEISVDVIDRASTSRLLVSELMILCNCLLAKFCGLNGLPAAYRTQAMPEGPPPAPQPGPKYDPVLEFSAGRRMAPAQLSAAPGAHAGLGVTGYIQATAPLRRYTDMVMQRQVGSFIRRGAPLYSAEEVAAIAASADVQVRELARIERQRKRYWFLKFLKLARLEKGGSSDLFRAVALDRRERGPSPIELLEYPFRARIQLTDRDSAGDELTVRLHKIDLWTRSAHFIRAP